MRYNLEFKYKGLLITVRDTTKNFINDLFEQYPEFKEVRKSELQNIEFKEI